MLDSLFWIKKITAISVFFQSLEVWQLKYSFSKNGVWTWEILSKDYKNWPSMVQKILNLCMSEKIFVFMIQCMLLASAILTFFSLGRFVEFIGFLFLFLSNMMVSLRWRGSFNGASDSMVLILLGNLLLASACDAESFMHRFALTHIAIQTCLSLFLAGCSKFRQKAWRNGENLKNYLLYSYYGVPIRVKKLASKPQVMFVVSWCILIFQLFFPLSLLSWELYKVFFLCAAMFHFSTFASLD